jgi:alkanesulfonate monooxygenase
MLEAYATLGYLAARTTRIRLLALVTAVVCREPGLLARAVTTLDVLSEGRAWLGIGAASSEEEAHGLGLPFPPAAERFERLEEALQICLQMWSDNDGPYAGLHYQLARTHNSPQPLTRPHPPILIGGAGEKKTLRLVAQYAQACNLPAAPGPFPQAGRTARALRRGRPRLRRDREDVSGPLDPGPSGQNVNALIGRMRELARLGVTHYQGPVPGVASITPLEVLGRRVIPVAAEL